MDSYSPSPSPAPSGPRGASNATQRWSILRRALLARSSSARALGSADSFPCLPHANICVRFVLSFIRIRFIFVRRAIQEDEKTCLYDKAEGSLLLQTRKAQTLLLVLWILVQGD
jgi:hypothetical protein